VENIEKIRASFYFAGVGNAFSFAQDFYQIVYHFHTPFFHEVLSTCDKNPPGDDLLVEAGK
jgi:hypothetical protein